MTLERAIYSTISMHAMAISRMLILLRHYPEHATLSMEELAAALEAAEGAGTVRCEGDHVTAFYHLTDEGRRKLQETT